MEQDHKYLVEAIIQVTRQTDYKVLVCAEDVSQIKLGCEQIMAKLPDDVLKKVVHRDTFWMPDETNSVFRLSAGMFANDQHSPIMCIASGVPAILFRIREQGRKGYMWQDIGLGDWMFDLDTPSQMEKAVDTILTMAKNPKESAALC